jgi:hypothetical protein
MSKMEGLMSFKHTVGALSLLAATAAAAEPSPSVYLQSSTQNIPLSSDTVLSQALKIVTENTNFEAPVNNGIFPVNYKLASIIVAKPSGETITEIGSCFYYASSGFSRNLNRVTLGVLGNKEASITCQMGPSIKRTEVPATGRPDFAGIR